MAGLADIIRSAVATADAVTDTLQPKVRHAAWTGNDGEGGYTYATAVSRAAIIERSQKLVRTAAGEEVLSTSNILSVDAFVDKDTGAGYFHEVYLG